MEDFDMMVGEKLVDYRRPSVLLNGKFWAGIIFIAISIFAFTNSYANILPFPGYASSAGAFLALLGVPNLPIISGLPAIPTLLDVFGLLFIAYAELVSYFHRYFVTNLRIVERNGILVKDLNIIIPNTVSDISVDISILERILHIGKIIIRPEEKSKASIIFYAVPKPETFQNNMLKLMLKNIPDNSTESKT